MVNQRVIPSGAGTWFSWRTRLISCWLLMHWLFISQDHLQLCSCSIRVMISTVTISLWRNEIECMQMYFTIKQQDVFLAATKQLYEWFSPSVCPSVRLSVRPFWLCSHHCIITESSGVITNDKSDIFAKGRGQRSRSQRSTPNLTVSGP